MRKRGDLGFLSVAVHKTLVEWDGICKYGFGCDYISEQRSFSTAFGAHTGLELCNHYTEQKNKNNTCLMY
jgi:hypothetical protein